MNFTMKPARAVERSDVISVMGLRCSAEAHVASTVWTGELTLSDYGNLVARTHNLITLQSRG